MLSLWTRVCPHPEKVLIISQFNNNTVTGGFSASLREIDNTNNEEVFRNLKNAEITEYIFLYQDQPLSFESVMHPVATSIAISDLLRK